MICDVGPFSPFGKFDATITGSDVELVDSETTKVVIDLSWSRPECGPDVQHTFYIAHPNSDVEGNGKIFLKQLQKFTDIDELTDTGQLHGRRVNCTINNRLGISYGRAAA
jgi:hypothetical protein